MHIIQNKLRVVLLTLCLLTFIGVSSQTIYEFEKRLVDLFEAIKTSDSDSVRLKYNDSVKVTLENTLKLQDSFSYPFDSLQYLGKITSDDGKLRIYTWNVVTDSGLVFNGFLQKLSGEVVILQQPKVAYKPTTKEAVYSTSWYGALYYSAVAYKYKKQTVYMLAGWGQTNEFTQYKVLDVLSFDEFGNVRFGMPILFDEEKQALQRAVFEYDAHVVMHLDYERQRKRFVFDHLSPMKYFEDETVTLGPDMSVDSYVRKSKGWFLKEDLRMRNR
ncbi:MAG TPA: hypothetical protein PKY37_01085 [Paludibacteraceae bacterium]|nr:hypothetical protein [Paludibacteraceae bacterium]